MHAAENIREAVNVERLVSARTWRAVQHRMALNASLPTRQRYAAGLLCGLVHCGHASRIGESSAV